MRDKLCDALQAAASILLGVTTYCLGATSDNVANATLLGGISGLCMYQAATSLFAATGGDA